MSATETKDPFVKENDAEAAADAADPDTGKLFDVPRVGVLTDESDPTVLKIAFSGGTDLDRAIGNDVDFYNSLPAGKTVTLSVECHVAGAKRTHRRDSEGDVDAIVETKSLIVHSVEVAE